MSVVDHRVLLAKYMALVSKSEGSTYLGYAEPGEFTTDEMDELKRIDDAVIAAENDAWNKRAKS